MTIRMSKLGRRGMARVRALAMATIALVAVSTLGACVPGNEARSDAQELRLYTGPIPEPAPLAANATAGAEMPEPPTPPTDYTDEQALAEYEAEMQKYLEEAQAYTESMQSTSGDAVAFSMQVSELAEATAKSDEASVAAWQSLLVASGIAVGYGSEAVEVSGMEGAGIPMTMGELRLHALLGASPARIKLVDFAHMLGGNEALPEEGLAEALHDDLMSQLGTGFGAVFMALEPDIFTTFRYGQPQTLPLDEISLTGAQAALILRKLSVDMLAFVETNGGVDATLATVSSELGAAQFAPAGWRSQAAASEGPCGIGEEDPWQVEERRNVGKGLGWGFGEVVGKVPGFDSVKLALALSQAAVALASLLAKMMLMEADFSMGNAPLIRTKNREAGERREIVVALKYPEQALDDVRKCLSMLLAPLGFDLSDHDSGAASGVDVQLVMRNDRLWFSTERGGTASYLQKTGQNGIATFPVLGKPQAERLPEGAEPEEVTARVRAEANVEGSDLVKDLVGAGWDALGPSVAGIIASVAGRMKLVVFAWEVPVRDWKLVGDFDVSLTGELWGHSSTSRGGTSVAPCGTWVVDMSTTGAGTVESTNSSRVTAHYITEIVEGNPMSGLVFYPKGSSLDELRITEDGGELVHLPVGYSVTKSESAPGADPMPPHYSEPGLGGCGDGDPGYEPPQPDCGPRDYQGIASVVVLDGTVRVLGNEPIGRVWNDCGWRFAFADPLSPPEKLQACASAKPGGGEVPSMDSVFGERGWFEISGSLSCSRDGQGSLDRFTFDWTLKFCRVVDGTSEGC